MKHLQYTTQGTCSILIDVTADDDNVIQNVAFLGGCNGNLQGICRLVQGQKIEPRMDVARDERQSARETERNDHQDWLSGRVARL